MTTKSKTPSKAGEKQVRRNEKGQLLPGASLNPSGLNKGTKHARTIFEDFLKERYLVKRKILKEHEDGTVTMEEVQQVMTRWDALIQAQFDKAVEKGDGYLMTYLGDQNIGKATQTTRLESGLSLRGFELLPKDEEEVDNLFSINTGHAKKNTKSNKGKSR